MVAGALTHELTARTDGPSVARAVQVTDAVPAAVVLTDASMASPCTRTGQAVACAFGDLDPGAARVVRITGTVRGRLVSCRRTALRPAPPSPSACSPHVTGLPPSSPGCSG